LLLIKFPKALKGSAR